MNGSGPSIRKPPGGSPGVIITLSILTILAWVAGGVGLAIILAVVLFGYLLVRPSRAAADRVTAGTTELGARVEFLERRFAELQGVVDDLRAGRPPRAAAPAPEPAPSPRATAHAPPPTNHTV